jgi:paraquat-inducible protein B
MTAPEDSGGRPPDSPDRPESPDVPEADVRRRRFSLNWLVPIVAAAIAIYLGWRTASTRGPIISIGFHTANGLVAGQTSVKYKAVDLGTVESIRISDDRSHVVVRVRMRSEAEQYLTDHARFWVVRPRLTGGNITGLETLVSGAYIELDPGARGGKSRRNFVGLERPPSVRSDEPGTTFILKADRIGALGIGAPVFFRDVPVGEVLSYDPPGLGGDIVVHAFVRKPYDSYVRAGSRFWSASGVRLDFGRHGVKLQMQSLQALVSGGVAFDTPPSAYDEPPVPADTAFKLYADEDAAVSADAPDRLSFVMHFHHSVRGLGTGSPVLFYGQRVGSVTDVRLQYDAKTHDFRVPVHIAVNPAPIALAAKSSPSTPQAVARELVARGLHARIETANYLTGQLVVSLSLGKKGPAKVSSVGGAGGLPAEAAGHDTRVD